MRRARIVRPVAVAVVIVTLLTKSVPKTIAVNVTSVTIVMMMRKTMRKADLASPVVPVVWNAQERRAALEVEQIEEDLILDDITYAPIDDETRGNRGDDDDDEQPTRTRRRRRGHGSRGEADERQQENVEGEPAAAVRRMTRKRAR